VGSSWAPLMITSSPKSYVINHISHQLQLFLLGSKVIKKQRE